QLPSLSARRASLLCGAGCARTPRVTQPAPTAREAAAPTSAAESRVVALGNSVSGAPITMYVLGAGPEAVLIFSAIHGNQPARAFVDRKLLEHIEASPSVYDDRRVALITVVNPDGLVAGARTNANCVDCNRNFLRPTGRPGSGAAPTGVRGRAASRRLWPGQKNGRGCWRQSAAARSSRWRGRSI